MPIHARFQIQGTEVNPGDSENMCWSSPLHTDPTVALAVNVQFHGAIVTAYPATAYTLCSVGAP